MRRTPAVFALFLTLSSALTGACGDPTAVDPRAASLEFLADSTTIDAGDSVQLSVKITLAPGGPGSGGARPVTWTSLDTGIATVDSSGMVRGLAAGDVAIVATADSVSDTAMVTVLITFTSISAGADYTCGVTTLSDAYCWGAGGRLGTGDLLPRLTPTRVSGGVRWARVEAELSHTCGLDLNGSAFCWGAGGQGQLGTGLTASSTTPAAVSGGLTFVTVELGAQHTCGLTPAGSLYCWGSNNNGQIGTGVLPVGAATYLVPTAVTGGLVFSAVNAGDLHNCGLTVDSLAYCWGRNNHGQTGDSTTVFYRPSPVPVHGGHQFVRLALGTHAASCGVVSGDTLYCWGHNDFYQLARAPNLSDDLPVLPVSGGIQLGHASIGAFIGCGLTSAGGAYCWGQVGLFGLTGALGGLSDVPVPVGTAVPFTTISLDDLHACGMATDGRAYCWGRNGSGELGIGHTSTQESVPLPVKYQR